MTDSEKRRLELLHQTRMLYSDRRTPPAVHPRFHTTYANLYDNQGRDKGSVVSSTLGIRIFIAIVLFGAFVAFDYNEAEYAEVNSTNIVQEIEKRTEDVFADFME